MVSLKEKIGYGFGDMASSMFWKIFSYYLPFFYSNIFGLSLADAAILLLVTRVWDAVSDPMMGILADRTKTRWGKYRPYLLWIAAPFSICGILVFTTPDLAYAGKLIWAYITYILMMTVYTAINVPYGAMLGVMTDNSNEKTVFSSYRMFFAYGGSFIALSAWEPLCNKFTELFGGSVTMGYQFAMISIGIACFLLFLCCFALTKERIRSISKVSIGADFKSLLSNGPWWILIGAALCTNLFNTLRGATVAYYFTDVVGSDASLVIFSLQILFYSGLFLSVGEVANMIGVALTVSISNVLGKKTTFIVTNVAMLALSIVFFYIPCTPVGFWLMLILQILISICTGIISPLIWSMYADVSDYAELKYKTASTGLIFSSSSMAQKFGGAVGGAAVMWIIAAFGYIVPDAASGQVISQSADAIFGLKMLMSWIPASVAALAIVVVYFYSLTTKRVNEINSGLKLVRKNEGIKID